MIFSQKMTILACKWNFEFSRNSAYVWRKFLSIQNSIWFLLKLYKDLIRDFWTFLSPYSSVEFNNLEAPIGRNGNLVTVFVYFAMRVYFGWWQIGWSWMNGSFWQTERCFLFITKQKRNFDFGFSKNTFFLKLKSDTWPCWHLSTLPLNDENPWFECINQDYNFQFIFGSGAKWVY